MSTVTSCHFGHWLQVKKKLSLKSDFLHYLFMISYMYIAPGAGADSPQGQNFDINRKALSLYPFAASFKEITLKSDVCCCFFFLFIFVLFFHDLIHVYSPAAGGHTAPRGQSFDVRNFLSLRSSIVRFKSQTTIVSGKIHCFTFFPYKSIRDQI